MVTDLFMRGPIIMGKQESTITERMKKPYKIQQVVNWFFGNYCTRKCYEENEKQYEHWVKLRELAKKLEGTEMMHKGFLLMIRTDKTICNLSDEEWRKRKFSWKHTDCQICKGLGIRF